MCYENFDRIFLFFIDRYESKFFFRFFELYKDLMDAIMCSKVVLFCFICFCRILYFY